MSKIYTGMILGHTINPSWVTLNEFNRHTHKVILDYKDKLKYHLVGRLEMSIDSYISNLVLSIIAHYSGFR
jgi:hypothetical protein